ncbi:hypothetical protein Dimus_005200 [Dionaea muscipula]
MDPSAAQLPAATEFHPVPAANPTPNHPPTPSHPPYAEMITAAIAALKEKDGSSKKAIAKYIEQVYQNLPPAHLALLTHHLKRLKNSGHLIMVKKSYMVPIRSDFVLGNPNHGTLLGGGGGGGIDNPFPASMDPSSASPAPRKRGRPPKPKLFPLAQQQQHIPQDPAADPGLSNGSKRRPGRPPKLKSVSFPLTVVPIHPEAAADDDVGVANGSVATPKRGRGRPPKSQLVVNAAGGELVVPALAQVQSVAESVVDFPRRRGRPKRNPSELAPLKPLLAIKRRGRPPLLGKVPGVFGKPGAKRRGRPPKNAAAFLAPGRRPMGHHKKYGSTARNPSSGQAEELTRRLEFIQACIKSAVSVLKPHVNLNAVDAVTALQRLEELATMNINPAPELPAPAPLPAAVVVPSPFNTTSFSADIQSQQLTFGNAM